MRASIEVAGTACPDLEAQKIKSQYFQEYHLIKDVASLYTITWIGLHCHLLTLQIGAAPTFGFFLKPENHSQQESDTELFFNHFRIHCYFFCTSYNF